MRKWLAEFWAALVDYRPMWCYRPMVMQALVALIIGKGTTKEREKMSKISRPTDPIPVLRCKACGYPAATREGLYRLKAWLRSLSYDDPDYYCGYELDFGMDRSQILDKIDELIKEGW